jgi:molybdenum cofactor synthesis domain-containing protein
MIASILNLSSSRVDSQRYLKLTDFVEVEKRIDAAFANYVPRVEEIPVEKGLSRVIAEDVLSGIDLPPADITAMDGYALRSSDLALASASNPIKLKIKGSLFPNNLYSPMSAEISDDETAYYVATGAPIPKGCDVVVRIEETKLDEKENTITIMERIPKGKDIAQKGEDIHVGEILVEKGQILNSQNVAMLMGVGKEKIKVFAVPKVGIISIGNELRTLQDPLKGGGLVNNYAHLTAGFLSALGANPILLGIAKDKQEEIAVIIKKGLEECDMVITIAGSSVGARDFTPNAILSLKDSSMMFHGMRLVPIRPAGVALVGNKPVIIVPGHAVSCTLTFFTLVLPILNHLAGLPQTSRRVMIKAKVEGGEFSNDRPIEALELVSLKKKEGDYVAVPLGWGSNLIQTLSKANGFVRVKSEQKISESEEVVVQLFGGFELERIIQGRAS